MNEFELHILDFIQEYLRFEFLDGLMVLITRLADHGICWIVLALMLICFKKTRKMGITLGTSLLLGLIIGNLGLKNIFARTRPYDVNTDVVLLLEKLSDYSFPSGHTLCSFASAMTIYLFDKQWGRALFVLSGVIAFSRMYLYVHYPTDIIGGVVVGLCIGILAFFVVDKVYKLINNKKGIEG